MVNLAVPPAPTWSHIPARSLWVWQARAIVDDPVQQNVFFDFLSAPKGEPKNQISVIFISRSGAERSSDNSKLQAFIAKAHSRSIRVDCLCGEAYYALPGRQKEGLWQLETVLKYNRRSPEVSRFDGIQYDVEPYALPGWPKQSILDNYLTFLDRASQMIKTASSPIQLGCAIPRWFDKADLHGLYKSVIDRVDYVAVMDYVDNSKSFVTDGSNEVNYGTKTGKKVWLGAETSKLPDEPRATFFAKGNAAMEEAFSAATRAFGQSDGFEGCAVEHYETYVDLRP